MKLLDIFSRIKKDESVEHDINPVYDTAKNCLVNLVTAHCEEAIRLNNELQFTNKTDKGNAITKGVSLFQEIRYRFLNEELKKTGIKNVLDIGCGYSPRGILLSELGYNYVGADLPAVVREIEPAVIKCIGSDAASRIKYTGLDATDPQSLLKAAEPFDGPVCILTEGLMMYFPIFELNEYLKGLQGVLETHGGCVITPDFCMNRLLKLSVGAFSWKKFGDLMQTGAAKIVKDYYVPTSSKMDPSVWYAGENDETPCRHFTSAGFKITRVPVYNPDMTLNMLAAVRSSRRKNLISEYQNTYGWVMTLF